MKKTCKLSKEQLKNLFDDYSKGLTTDDLISKYNITRNGVNYHLLKIRPKGKSKSELARKYPIKEDFFDVIDTEEKAYFLGLLFADGANNVKKGAVSLSLQEKDKHILDLFTSILQPKKPLFELLPRKNTHQIQYILTISNKYISEKLNELGCVQNKSQGVDFPTYLPDHSIHHFIRGYFDGDGCISNYLIKQKYSSCSISISGCYSFLKEIQDVFVKELGLNQTKILKDSRSNVNYNLVYGGRNNVDKIFNYIYNSSTIYLKRKYEKFKQSGN